MFSVVLNLPMPNRLARHNRYNRYTLAMPTLTHGSDLRLAPTLGPIADALAGSPRTALAKVAELGFGAVQLDATLSGMRPRELDQGARRDLAVVLRRQGLAVAGVDFFIPPDHYHDPEHLDRASDAARAACSLAADLGRVPLCVGLPTAKADAGVVDALLNAADQAGVPLVVHDEANLDALPGWLKQHARHLVVAGIDPAALLFNRADPTKAVASLGATPLFARLSDAKQGSADTARVTLGSGGLDVTAYRVVVDLAPQRLGPVVLDLRSLASPLAAATTAGKVWERSAMKL